MVGKMTLKVKLEASKEFLFLDRVCTQYFMPRNQEKMFASNLSEGGFGNKK